MMPEAPADGVTLLLAALLLALLFLWAWRDRVDAKRADTDIRHRRQRRAADVVDRIEGRRFLDDVWVDIELSEMLERETA